MDFKEFLIEAKVKCYASGREPKIFESGKKGLRHIDDIWRYEDTWYQRGNLFVSRELVFKDNELIWSMSTQGGGDEKYNHFLTEALRNPDKDFPIRGPKNFRSAEDEKIFYLLDANGDINDFNAYERLFYDGNLVHKAKCIGGSLI